MLNDIPDTLQGLAKENRILKKKLERSEADRVKLEGTNRKKESLLKQVISELQESQAILEKKSADLEQAITDLTLMQSKLVESEKMAALGSLVAGVAHEINTPVGTSITLASTLADETKILANAIAQGQLKRSLLNNYLDTAQDCTRILLSNLHRAGDLVHSFKQVAVDQTTLERRIFQVKPYLEEVVTSLSPHFKGTPHRLTVEGDEAITIHSYPGALAQVVTNLITNALTHAYPAAIGGQMQFKIAQTETNIVIRFSDDGCGISSANISRIFEPFFTTNRSGGGTGLGLHIVYNLVTQNLQGTIHVNSIIDKGTQFIITLPLQVLS
jgi:signal transduction histidine kinase